MTDKTTEKIPKVRGYDGPDDSDSLKRGISGVESKWNNEQKEITVGTLDEILTEQLKKVLESQRTQLNLLDIGSGPTAKLLRDIVSDSDTLPQFRQLLKANPSVKVRCIGLTDATSHDEFLQADPLHVPESQSQLEGTNVHFTLTAAQTLDKFLRHEKIDTLDCVFATFSLTYLGPKVFEQTVKSVIENLSDGGRFIAAGYAEDHPALQRDEFSTANLKIRNQNEDLIALDRRIFEKKRFTRIDKEFHTLINNEEFREMNADIEKAEKFIEKIGQSDPGFLAQIKRDIKVYYYFFRGIYYDIKNKREITINSLRSDFISNKQLKTVAEPLWGLERKLLMFMRKKKMDILSNLQGDYKDIIDLDLGVNLFVITKRTAPRA